MAVLLGPLAFGQSVPAATSWQKHPGTAVTPPTPIPPPPPLTGTTVPPAAPGSRVVLFTKPAGEVRAVLATEPKKDDKPKDDKKVEEKQEAQDAPRDPFVLRSDDDLRAEVDGVRNYPALVKDYQQNLPEYERKFKDEMEEYRKGVRTSKPVLRSPPLAVPMPTPPPFQPGAQVKAGYAPAQAVLEPSYVVHRRLFFEDKNSERYGWDLGFAQPFLSAGGFFTGVAFWPSKLTSNFAERYDTSAGKCPPGSPVAYYLYPPNITFGGGVFGAGAIVGTAFLLIP